MVTPQILIAEDDPLLRKGYSERFAHIGWNVTLAADGYETLRLAREAHYDVILLDLRMPYRSGAEVLRTLRYERALADAQVFVLAAPGDAGLVEEATRYGLDGVFEKSVTTPRDVAVELDAIYSTSRRADMEHREAAGRNGPASSGLPDGNVPRDVESMASRFRRGGTMSGTQRGMPAGSGRGTQRGSQRGTQHFPPQRPASHPGHTAHGGRPSVPPRPDPRHTDPRHTDPRHGDPRRSDPRMTDPRGRSPGRTLHDTYQRQDPPLARHDPRARSSGGRQGPGIPTLDPITGGVRGRSHRAPPPESMPLGDAPAGMGARGRTYDTVLNTFMGEALHLAKAMGLPRKLLCQACGKQLVLRLWPDPSGNGSVQGFFVCTTCAPE